MKKDKYDVVWRKRDIAAEVARVCKIPQEEALKIIEIILSYIKFRIHKDGTDKDGKYRYVVIERFGKFRVNVWGWPTFTANKSLRRIVKQNPEYRLLDHARKVSAKIIRLEATGKRADKKLAKHQRYVLTKYLATRPKTRQYIIDHYKLPDGI